MPTNLYHLTSLCSLCPQLKRRGGEEVEGLGKKEKGLRDMGNSVVIVGGGHLRRLHGNGKNVIKLNFKKN